MPSQSPQRTVIRKQQAHLSQQGPMQNITPREMTPSPSFREKQRAIKAHSMPSVPSVGQILASQNGQMMYPQGQQQPSPTTSNSSHQSRRSPPPASRISPTAPKSTQSDRAPDRQSTPPPLMHAHSQPIIPQLANQHHPRPVNRVPAPFLTQFQNQEDSWAVTEELMAEFEREHGQFASHAQGTAGVAYAGGAASSRVKPRHSDSLPVPVSATAPAKDPAVERVRATDRASPKDSDSGSVGQAAKRQQVRDKEREAQAARESPKTRDRSGTVSSQHVNEAQGHARTPEYRGSPQYQTPMASPGERTAAYTQYVPESYQQGPPSQQSSQPPTRKPVPNVGAGDAAATRSTPPATSKLANSHTPPLQAVATRPPDRSLPVQEEPEEDVGHEFEHDDAPQYAERHHSSPTPSSDIYPEGHATRYDTRHDQRDEDDDETLNEEADDHMPQNKSSEDSESGFTPRSPSTNLPERTRDGQYIGPTNQYAGSNGQYGQTLIDNQKTIRQKPRGGATDQLGMRSFDPAMFERDIHNLRSNTRDSPANGQRERASQSPPQLQQQQVHSEPPKPTQHHPQQQPYYDPRLYPLQHILDQRLGYQWNGSEHQSDDMQSLMDDPTSSYLHSFLRSASARPGAPVPPTPQSHTAAPSPSPLISATPSDVEPRQIGSPYPYPFTHIRRSTVSGPMQAPSTNYDLNNPAVIREQMALQMQIYALNNGLAPPSSESAFSPSSTPYPGPGYNPWAFVPAATTAGLNAHMAAASVRSSPSHQPVSLPPPPMRGRGIRRREPNGHVRAPQPARQARRVVKPPPRVDSTQPRETSPELSSGEETSIAGDDHFVDPYGPEMNGMNGNVNGNGTGAWDEGGMAPEAEDDGEWVDEEEDWEDDDLLDLEYHPTFVSNPQKRRRRFDTRWDALVQAFQALDRETDTTLVLLAAPSHSTKLHALTSRAIRRDATLTNSPALANLRRSFSRLAVERRAARKAQRMSLAERLSSRSVSSEDGSPGANSPGDMDLRRALDAALGSLGALNAIYEQREARWRDEMRKQNEDRERIELLLRQALGPVMSNGHHGGSAA